jgi:pimeloyl-ACP methyl ester carboxylesterase
MINAMTAAEKETTPWVHHDARVNGVRLHYVEAGAGPLVLLLHGFPEFWYSWRWQIPALAAAGFRVLAPDLRGYNLSEKPAGVHRYRLEALTADVAGLIRHTGACRAFVAGHDWGGAIAWTLAMRQPDVVEKLIILNAPHPGAFIRELRTWSQRRKSWYILFFQLPLVPEWYLRAGNYAALDKVFRRDPVRTDSFTEDDIKKYKEALGRPRALTSALNYYRAVFHQLRGAAQNIGVIDIPTLLIWGEKDRYLGLSLTLGLERWVSDLRIERIAEASHWVQLDARERVNQSMVDFLTTR